MIGNRGAWSQGGCLAIETLHGGTEINAMSRRCRGHKELRRCSVQILDNFRSKYYDAKMSNKTGKQTPSLHAPTVPPWHCVYLRPLRVSVWDFVRILTLSGKPYHSKILKTQRKRAASNTKIQYFLWNYIMFFQFLVCILSVLSKYAVIN